MEDLAKAPAPYLAEQVCVPEACMVMVVESSTGRVWGPHTLLTCQGGSCEGAPPLPTTPAKTLLVTGAAAIGFHSATLPSPSIFGKHISTNSTYPSGCLPLLKGIKVAPSVLQQH